MKVIPIALQTHYDSGCTRMAYAMVLKRTDDEVYGFTSAMRPFTMDVTAWNIDDEALVFDAKQGLDASEIVTSAGFAVDNLEITTLDDGTFFDRDDILAGLWDNTRFLIFRYRWDVAAPTIENDVEPLLAGWFGEITLNTNTIKFELRDLKQKLQQPVGIVSTKSCRVRLGSDGVGKCGKDLTAFTHSLTVTDAASNQVFTASADLHADDYYGEGLVMWITGNNAGVSEKVRISEEGGIFTLVLPMGRDIQIGDTFTAIAGCRKRLLEDCRDKFDNVLNFQGEPHRPLTENLMKPVAVNV